jgi:hypothetical protein
MSIGSLGSCAATLPETMQENRLQQLSSPLDSTLPSSESIQNSALEVEPASIDIAQVFSPVNSVSATEPILNLTIETTLANNINTANSYQANGKQNEQNTSLGLLIDIKV